jgi:succinate dehydrogenase / fumarate reductase, cytochrome b subunit
MRRTPLSSTTGTKVLIAATGLGLFGFLLIHVAGNYLFFLGPEVFNDYSHKLTANPLLLLFEFGLLALFLTHALKAAANFVRNRRARPVRYHRQEWAGPPSKKTFASTTMIVTGLLTVIFLVIHLKGLRFGPHYETADGIRDLYRLQVEYFRSPLVVAFYVLSMAVIGLHLWHGFWSAFQSFGLGSARYTPRLVTVSKAVAALIAAAFAVIPVWIYVRQLPRADLGRAAPVVARPLSQAPPAPAPAQPAEPAAEGRE